MKPVDFYHWRLADFIRMGEIKLTMDDILFRCGKIMFQIRLFLEMGKNGDFFMFFATKDSKNFAKSLPYV